MRSVVILILLGDDGDVATASLPMHLSLSHSVCLSIRFCPDLLHIFSRRIRFLESCVFLASVWLCLSSKTFIYVHRKYLLIKFVPFFALLWAVTANKNGGLHLLCTLVCKQHLICFVRIEIEIKRSEMRIFST